MNNTGKALYLIVEGPSDEDALGVKLEEVFAGKTFDVYVVHGDITSKYGVTSSNIVTKVNEFIKEIMKKDRLKKSDFIGIIHLSDTDGAYIHNDNVVEDMSAQSENDDKIMTDEAILTSNKAAYEDRNYRKKQNMNRLNSTHTIMGIPYMFLYMSSCLDHVLYDKRNLRDEEKEYYAYRFARKYKNDTEGFLKFICNSDFSVPGTFRETWDYIQEGTNSLKRHTNLRLAIEEYAKEEKAE